eukprot:4086609-Alexandrium_andersonii.AAC.1
MTIRFRECQDKTTEASELCVSKNFRLLRAEPCWRCPGSEPRSAQCPKLRARRRKLPSTNNPPQDQPNDHPTDRTAPHIVPCGQPEAEATAALLLERDREAGGARPNEDLDELVDGPLRERWPRPHRLEPQL